uniref:Plectrovirus spv1-r8a2b orf 5 transmembrane protein n=1 Tax=Spiroplasma citri TaxID=2133 RepID=Q14KT5_SPICI|nr:plectrovirus spv1-r8a2b orf 5 transmembrane protein [Spiroplasma citri]
MINLLVENNNSNWDKIFSFVFDIFLFIFDVIWNTKLPMTNTSIAYFLVFFMVIKLSIYAIHGTSTQYNNLFSTVNNGVSQVYSSTVRGVSDTKQGMQKHIKERKQFKINRNKKQLSSLAKQAKTREQGYRRVHK